MLKRSRTGKPDVNQRSANMIDVISGDLPKDELDRAKNPAAVALGRLGGLKGGVARAAKLSTERRRKIAQKAALARWRKD